MHTNITIKKTLQATWLFASGVSLIALAVNVNAQEWGRSGIMILLLAYDLLMLHLTNGLLPEDDIT